MSNTRRYVEWRINTGHEEFEVVRRDDFGTHLVGTYPRMDRAREAAEEDRRTVLADPLAVERCPLEVRVKRG